MSPQDYIQGVIAQRSIVPIQLNDIRLAGIMGHLKTWAGTYLNDIKLSGSSAKNLVVQGQPDTDVFISIKSNVPPTLKEIYVSLENKLRAIGISPTRRTVALNINYNGLDIDLVPGKLQTGYFLWHSLYNSETGNWLQTNIDEHIKISKKSGRDQEIRATKIWAKQKNLKFPSLYLELMVIDALHNKNKNQLDTNVLTTLLYLRDNITTARVVDPANTNNILSDYMLSTQDKQNIASAAKTALSQNNWNMILV